MAKQQISQSQIGPGLLGSAQTTSIFSTSSGTPVQVTGLTVTVTVPTLPAGRKIKVTLSVEGLYANSSSYINLSLWRGTVGSGTQIAGYTFNQPSASAQTTGATCIGIDSPSAGSVTYNVGFKSSAGTASIEASTGIPATLLVEIV